MANAEPSQHLSDALVGFALEGRFPEDVAGLPPVPDIDLGPAIQALGEARLKLQVWVFEPICYTSSKR